MKRATVGVALAAGLLLGIGGTAFAGETTGNGTPVKGGDKAHSACRFSGRDLPDEEENNPPGFDDDAITGGHVQSYGQIVSFGLKDAFPSPGIACRGNAEGEGG